MSETIKERQRHCGHGNVYRYQHADHRSLTGRSDWVPKDGDLCLRIGPFGEFSHGYVALRSTPDGRFQKVGEFISRMFGEPICKLESELFHRACVGEPISLQNDRSDSSDLSD